MRAPASRPRLGEAAATLQQPFAARGAGCLLRRALDLRAASRMGIQVMLADIAADEFQAMAILDEERERWEKERQGR